MCTLPDNLRNNTFVTDSIVYIQLKGLFISENA